MNRQETESEIRAYFGRVPTFFQDLPDYLLSSDWESYRNLELEQNTAIPPKYRELIGLAVSGATRCRYCVLFHTEAARLFGATEQELNEAALVAKNTMGWSTYLNTRGYDYDEFRKEFDQIAEHLRQNMAAGVGA